MYLLCSHSGIQCLNFEQIEFSFKIEILMDHKSAIDVPPPNSIDPGQLDIQREDFCFYFLDCALHVMQLTDQIYKILHKQLLFRRLTQSRFQTVKHFYSRYWISIKNPDTEYGVCCAVVFPIVIWTNSDQPGL